MNYSYEGKMIPLMSNISFDPRHPVPWKFFGPPSDTSFAGMGNLQQKHGWAQTMCTGRNEEVIPIYHSGKINPEAIC